VLVHDPVRPQASTTYDKHCDGNPRAATTKSQRGLAATQLASGPPPLPSSHTNTDNTHR